MSLNLPLPSTDGGDCRTILLMFANEPVQVVPALRRRARRLRVAGTIVLLAGISGAKLLYWFRTRGANFSNDASMLGFDRSQRRQMEMLYGKSGD